MKYAIKGLDGDHECTIATERDSEQYIITIDGRKQSMRILDADSDGIDFVLGNEHHHATYLKGEALETRMILDGLDMSVMRHTGLDKIVFQNSGKSDSSMNKNTLASPLPGKVVSVAVNDGDNVKKDDLICTLESMKMQTSVKAHKDGKITLLAVSAEDTVSKGFVIAEIT